MSQSERTYSLQREKAERLAAERAALPAARDIHNALADHYAALARVCEQNGQDEAP